VEEHCMQAIFAQTIRTKHVYPGDAGRTERGVGGGQREVWGEDREGCEGRTEIHSSLSIDIYIAIYINYVYHICL
jgi:hypothetical protein